ncbi:MAG TPA: YcgN family cysteine cluster protein [Beijerinckiaceae bacterium]|nr:YcgN family cysteine cluster protein [Beijerinckiaceae bacterium]
MTFWKGRRLTDFTASEWESLCDGCGRCCLVKLEDEDTGRIHATDIACRLFDEGSCRCRDYDNRSSKVPDCVRLTPDVVPTLNWLPPTCAYRLVANGRDLPWWHPLVSGRPETVVEAGVSVLGRTSGLEDDFTLEETMAHVVAWPQRWPRKRNRE